MASWIIPTLHPSALIRDNTMQLAVLSDLQKAMRIQRDGGPTLVPACYRAGQSMPDYTIFPTTGVILEWLAQHRGQTLSIDIESTYQGQIMCLAMWPVATALTGEGICVPFFRKGAERYWNAHHELTVKQAVFSMLSDPTWPKIGQNFVGFDAPLMLKTWGVQTRGIIGDTMVAHWCCMPELPHGLAFLSSIFTDLSPFKREVHANENEKDDMDKWSAIQDYDDRNLREYCLLDTFATALTWTALEEIMS